MTRQDSLQNQVSCGSLILQVNLFSGYLNHRKIEGNFSFALFIKVQKWHGTTIFIQ